MSLSANFNYIFKIQIQRDQNEKSEKKKTEAPHVLEFLGESIDNLNVRDDILSTKNDRHSKVVDKNFENEFEKFLSTGRHEPNVEFDEPQTSKEEEDDFYDFLSTGKYRQEKNKYVESVENNEIVSNDLDDFLSIPKGRFKRTSQMKVGDANDNGVTKLDEYFSTRDSLFGGSTWDGHYLGDIW